MPGLAGSGTVSFESVNFPGYYLRHYGFDFQLAAQRRHRHLRRRRHLPPGRRARRLLWSSFQSYNYPDRYIRHYAYVLRLDPITTATARSDATFRVTS